MRFFLLMAAYGIAGVALETTWLANWPAAALRIDFLMPAVAAVAFYQERRQALPVLILYGILMDVASGAPFGISIVSYLLIYSGIRLIVALISFQEGLGLLFWVAVMSVADKLVGGLLMLVTTGEAATAEVMLKRAPAQALLDAAAALALVPFITWYWSLSWEKLRRPKGLVMR
jgi:cell shape-determining protein MreD